MDLSLVLGFVQNLSEFFHARKDSGERRERRLHSVRQQVRQRRFAAPWRSPENQGGQDFPLGNLFEQATRTEESALTDVLVKRAGPHAFGEWGFLGCRLCGTMSKQIVSGCWHLLGIIPEFGIKGRAVVLKERPWTRSV